MKNIITSIFSLIILSSCASLNNAIEIVPGQLSYYSIDFREYTDKGFLFTPYSYGGNYQPVGLIQIDIRPEAHYKKANYFNTKSYWEYKKLSNSDLLKVAYEKAIEMGADAVVDFKILTNYEPVNVGQGIYAGNLPVYNVTGFAIKRK